MPKPAPSTLYAQMAVALRNMARARRSGDELEELRQVLALTVLVRNRLHQLAARTYPLQDGESYLDPFVRGPKW